VLVPLVVAVAWLPLIMLSITTNSPGEDRAAAGLGLPCSFRGGGRVPVITDWLDETPIRRVIAPPSATPCGRSRRGGAFGHLDVGQDQAEVPTRGAAARTTLGDPVGGALPWTRDIR
jgi:hypothetical protein